MKYKWIIEKDAFDENSSQNIIDALKAQDVEFKIFTNQDYFEEKFNHYPAGEKIWFYGSVQAAKVIKQKSSWDTSHLPRFENYKCSIFYPILGSKMLSSEYAFLPFKDLQRLWGFYQEAFNNDCLFIRPDEGDKKFSGQVVENVDRFFAKEYVYLNQFCEPDTMCLLANAYNISKEYRLLICNGKFVTGSQYRLNGQIHRSTDVPQNVINYAEEISSIYSPDMIFILDVCESKNNLYVLEVNPVHCAGLYKMDAEIFVSTINDCMES